MTLATLLSRTPQGLEAPQVRVDVDVGNGLPAFSVVGLLETAVKESKDRVRAALVNCGYEFPAGRVTVNLAPADLPKEGGRFDLAIAVGILAASEVLPAAAFDSVELYGELSLGGDVRSARGILPSALQAVRAGHALVVPSANGREAALARQARVFVASHLRDVVRHAGGMQVLSLETRPPECEPEASASMPDLADVRGQAGARRALEIAAAGGHSLLFIGPPGSGKSMLAERLSSLLPPLTHDEMLRVASIASVAGDPRAAHPTLTPPFRAPHHTTSAQALVGGGTRPRPGEISLAHRGVLFLDELPEFSRSALEALREPLESGVARISRVHEQLAFPAEFMLVAAMNPCFCGLLGDGTDRCRCTPAKLEQYRGRISGPLLDRFDLHIEVPRVPFADISEPVERDESSLLREAVMAARRVQLERNGRLNARLDARAVWRAVTLGATQRALLKRAAERWQLSARGSVRVLKVARTIADLAGSQSVTTEHLAEALQLRCRDRV